MSPQSLISATIRSALRPVWASPSMRSLVSVETSERAVALTFDDGPDPEWTPRLLDILRSHGARATFFVVGEAASANPDILKRARDDGHELGNHTWNHPSLPTLPASEQRQQILRCDEALGEHSTGMFRPPYGHQTLSSRWATHRTGHSVVVWSKHIRDWNKQEPEEFSSRLRETIQPGNIILLHDKIRQLKGSLHNADLLVDRTPVFEALDTVLGEIKGDYECVTVPELLQRGRPRYELWRQKPASVQDHP